MAGNTAIIAKAGKAFDKVRKRFTPASVEVLLLKSSETETEYDVVWQTDGKWFFDSSAKPPLLYLAETALNLQDPMAESTHVQIGEQIFVMTPDDITPPDELGGPRVFWTIVCDKFAKRSHYAAVY